ncbi:hypothetical protein BBF96_08210 [Anoxybacter fermentans]|uniref:Glycosyltransferase 2-like domain-containing protein n=1 Tax=Anoxybacter fermentans TaxID=1323375 RepID=A0A3Q9HQD6_9FIRM|nr:glycosyltransferase family 2 protein [Anoxybacter fermentans]AZR73367.1 hypothetical protein BBF96_08210 [Anoxybacter fermentans]
MKQPKISLCMIVRNEERNLHRCLESVKGLVDEIIIIDTGSTDRTVQIGKEHGAKVLVYPWNNDFSQARNLGLAAAQGEWILYLDADEALSPLAQKNIKKLLNAPDIEGYFFEIVNFTGKVLDSSRLVHQSCRLFRNRKDYRFMGRIHEQILPSILSSRPNAQILKTDLQIYHYGYMEGNVNRVEKVKRNIELLQIELNQNKNNSFLEYHLGLAYYELGEKKAALEWLKKSYQHLEKGYAFGPTLVRNIALCLIDLGDYQEALDFIEKEIKNYSDYTDLFYLSGLCYLNLKNYSRAIKEFQKCLLLGEVASKYTTTAGTGTFLAHYGLGRAYHGLCENEQAINNYVEAVHIEPSFIEPLYPLVKLLKKKYQNINQVVAYLETEFDFESKYGLAVMADLCGVLGEDQLALSYLERLKTFEELSKDLKILYAKSLLGAGLCNTAYNQFLEILSQPESPDALVLELCLAQWLKNPQESINKLNPKFLERLDVKLQKVLRSIDQLWVLDKEQSGLKRFLLEKVQNWVSFVKEDSTTTYSKNLDEYIEKLMYVLEKCLRYKGFELFQKSSKLLLELDFDQWKLHYLIGELYFKYGYFNEAADELLKSLEFGVQNERVYYYLGEICEQRGLLSEAENLYCHALNINDRMIEYHLAAVRVALKRSKKVVRQILKIAPEAKYFEHELRIIEYCLKKLG